MKLGKVTVILLVLVSLFAISCGGNKESSSSSSSGGTSEAVTPDDGLQGELVYWSMWNQTEPQGATIKEAIDDFMKIHPGVKVHINWAGREIRKTLQPALDNDQKIDIWDEDLERVVKTWGDYAMQLDAYVLDTYESTNGQPYKDVVMGNMIDMGASFSKDGGVYAIPYQPFLFAFMYNKDHFAEAGIAKAPETWADFVEACAKLKAAGFVPLTTDDAYVDTLLGYHLARYKGSDWVAELVMDTTGELWSDPVVLETAKAYEELASKGYFSSTVGANKWPAGQQNVAVGEVSMYLNGTWLVNEIMGTTGPDFPWGTFSYPTVPGGTDGHNAANYGTQAFQINKNCAYPNAAFELLIHLTTGKWDSEIAKRSYGVPVSGTAVWPSQLSDAKEIFAQLDTFYPWAAGIQTNTDKFPVIAESFTKLISGSLSAEEFVERLK